MQADAPNTALLDDRSIACHDCDLLLVLPHLEPGETARCPRCNTAITSHVADHLQRILAFALASVILLGAALGYPFLTLYAGGLSNAATLRDVMAVMITSGEPITATLVAGFVVVIPGLMMLATMGLAITLMTNGSRRLASVLARSVSQLEEWAMVEVFIIGVIVSLVKIAAMADVDLGLSFWAYIGFTVTFVLTMSNFDRVVLWRQIEALRGQG